MTDTSTILGTALTFGGYVIAGGFAVSGFFNRQQRSRRADNDLTATNLINNLKTTTEVQEKEIDLLRAKEIDQGKQIANMQGQIKVLSDILQGRDPAMQKFLSDAPEVARLAAENILIAKNTASIVADLAEKRMTELTNSINNLVKVLTPPAPEAAA